MKKKAGFWLAGILILAVFAAFIWANGSDSLRLWLYGYRPGALLQHTPEQITEVYGDFDQEFFSESGDLTHAEYRLKENTPEFVMSRDDSLWLVLGFRAGRVDSIYIREGQIGG